MDLVNRLKLYMDSANIAISQFADTCNIPRPTLSQLLNGRNKKVSDEIISKIHKAYPDLSVMWLLFGEGDMVFNGNIEISEAQKAPEGDNIKAEQSNYKEDTIDGVLFENETQLTLNKSGAEPVANSNVENVEYNIQFGKKDNQIAQEAEPRVPRSEYSQSQSQFIDFGTMPEAAFDYNVEAEIKKEDTENQPTDDEQVSSSSKQSDGTVKKDIEDTCISLPTVPNKKITNIVVFYSDNSFQSFSPSM